jgi:hypothetical protein
MLLAAFLMQPQHPRRAARSKILYLHLRRRGDPREAVGEGSAQRAVAEIPHGLGRNAVDQPPLVAFQHGRLARLDDVLGAAGRKRRELKRNPSTGVGRHPFCSASGKREIMREWALPVVGGGNHHPANRIIKRYSGGGVCHSHQASCSLYVLVLTCRYASAALPPRAPSVRLA